jgi:hypothetical protein
MMGRDGGLLQKMLAGDIAFYLAPGAPHQARESVASVVDVDTSF